MLLRSVCSVRNWFKITGRERDLVEHDLMLSDIKQVTDLEGPRGNIKGIKFWAKRDTDAILRIADSAIACRSRSGRCMRGRDMSMRGVTHDLRAPDDRSPFRYSECPGQS